MKSLTFLLPTYWANYFFNYTDGGVFRDKPDLQDKEVKFITKWLKKKKLQMPVSVESSSFLSKMNDSKFQPGILTQVSEYTFFINK